MMTLWIVGRD